MFRLSTIATKYMLKTAPYFILVALIPSALMGLYSTPLGHIFYFYDYANNIISPMPKGYVEIINDMFGYFPHLWMIIVDFALMLIFASLIMGLMERHLRSGRFGFRQPFRRINDSLLALLPVTLALIIVQVLFSFIASGIVALSHYIFADFGAPPTAWAFIVSITVICVLQLILIIFYSMGILIPSTYMIVGYPYFSSVSYASKLRQKDAFSLFVACFVPFFVVFIIGVLGRLIDQLLWLDLRIVNTISYTYLFLYFTSLSMTAYYELSGTERMDYRRKLGIGG